MLAELVLGCLVGATIGAAIGWFGFNTVPAAIGAGSALAAGTCGVIIALLSRRDRKGHLCHRDHTRRVRKEPS